MRHIAAFDFDGTLTRRDVLGEFTVRFAGLCRVARALLRNRRLLAGALLGRVPRDELKAGMFADIFVGFPIHDLELAGIVFADRVRRRRLRPDMLARLMWHRRLGHETVIVSAGLEAYLEPLAAELGIDHVIGVRLAVDEAGRLTGQMAGGNVRGPRKATLLAAWIGGDGAEIWAYGDSPGDAELLAMADHPTWVGRGRRNPP